MKVKVYNPKDDVAHLEIIIPKKNNNADFINDVLIPSIRNTGFHPISSGGNPEIRWCKNKQGQNVLTYFGSCEGRTTLTKVISELEML